MRSLIAGLAGACLALSMPIASASAAMPGTAAVQPVGSGLVQADWNAAPTGNHGYWHPHWRHEWRDHWRPEWHHHWHHRWDRPYGYQY